MVKRQSENITKKLSGKDLKYTDSRPGKSNVFTIFET
jgi:hypothetical protein